MPGRASNRANGGVTRLSNTDYVAHVEDLSKYPAQSLLLDLLIQPQALPTLWKVASAFQRIRWVKLEFELVPQVSTSTSGGLIMAPLVDPNEILPSTELVQFLTSQKGSKAFKAFESASVSLHCKNEWLYTAGGTNERFKSPGRLVVASDSRINASAGATLTCHWTVELKMPGVTIPENPQDDDKITLSGVALWVNGTISVWDNQKTPQPLPVPSWPDVLPGMKWDVAYRMSVPYLYVGFNDGNQVWNYRYLRFNSSSQLIELSQHPDLTSGWAGTQFKHSNLLLTHSDVLTEAIPPEDTVGEESASLCDLPTTSRQSETANMMSLFERFMLSQRQ